MDKFSKNCALIIKSLLVTFACLVYSCKQKILPESPDKLYEKYRKSVVLIRNQYYYEVELSNGTSVYFTELKNGEISDLYFDEDEARKNANIVYGTGFFISKEGEIATNRHVVSPEIDDANVLTSLKIKFDDIKFKIQDDQKDLTEKISNIDNYISINSNPIDFSSLQAWNDRKQTLDKERSKLSVLITAFDFEPSKSNIKNKSIFLGIAYDNTFVNKQTDFKECVLIKKSSEKDIDLALIQLKDKTTPQNIQVTFDFDDHNPNIKNRVAEKGDTFDINNQIKINTKVYMIGFNYGFAVGNTAEGLKVQLTQGTVSQESDNKKVLYSIPSLEGSSGSPIIDQWGNLVAINFAKIINTQSFSYGIPVKQLKRLKSDTQ